jgi:hypothetical protein
MKSKINVIAMMYQYDVRRSTGTYTFGFLEGKYKIEYHSHSTGRDLNIYIVSPDGESMRIYDVTEWYSRTYYFNGFGKGYVQGPWVAEVEQMFCGFRKELCKKINSLRIEKRNRKKERLFLEKEKYNKFASLCV